MNENGIFIALITINLTAITLIGSYILAKNFFYGDRIDDLTLNLRSLTDKLIQTSPRITTSYKIDYHSEFANLDEAYSSIILNKEIEIETEKFSKLSDDERNKNDNIINKALSFIGLEAQRISLLHPLFIDNEDLTLDEKKLGILNNKIKNQIKKTSVFLNYYFKPNIVNGLNLKYYFSKYTERNRESFVETAYNLIEQEMESLKNKLDIMKEISEAIEKIEILKNHLNKKRTNNILIPLAIFELYFGIIFPLLAISTFSYDLKIDFIESNPSVAIGTLLSIISLFPYTVLIGMAYKTSRLELNIRHTSDTPST